MPPWTSKSEIFSYRFLKPIEVLLSKRVFSKFHLLQSVMTPGINIRYWFWLYQWMFPSFLSFKYFFFLPEAECHGHRHRHLITAMDGLSIPQGLAANLLHVSWFLVVGWMLFNIQLNTPDLAENNRYLFFFLLIPSSLSLPIAPLWHSLYKIFQWWLTDPWTHPN